MNFYWEGISGKRFIAALREILGTFDRKSAGSTDGGVSQKAVKQLATGIGGFKRAIWNLRIFLMKSVERPISGASEFLEPIRVNSFRRCERKNQLLWLITRYQTALHESYYVGPGRRISFLFSSRA